MMKSRIFSFIILFILLSHAEGKRGGGGGRGRGGSSSKGKPFSEWPWIAQAAIVIVIIIGVPFCLCLAYALCCSSDKSDDDNGEAVNLSSIQNTPDEHFNQIKTVQETPNPMTCPAHLQESNTLPYPALPQEANVYQNNGESPQNYTPASPPHPQGWIIPQGSNSHPQTGNSQSYPPACEPQGYNSDTPAVPPPAYDASDDSSTTQSMYPPASSTTYS